jgi:L-lactate dehydrogenase complex protein LldG
MDILGETAKELYRALDNKEIQTGLKRSISNLSISVDRVLNVWPYLEELASKVREIKEETLNNLDYYIDLTMRNVKRSHGHPYFARNREEALKILDEIIGDDSPLLIVKAKSMVTEEVGIREHLISLGHSVYETDLGELLIQISRDKPMHAIAPAIHIPKEGAIELLRRLGLNVREGMNIEEIVMEVRSFLRRKFVDADIGISGANVVAADTGSIILISNEGNIRNTTSLPPVHIAVTGVEKIMPTLSDAFMQALVQAGYAGLYPPTYLSIIAGPSSTADIEYHRVYGVHGPKEFHMILYDGGRLSAIKDPFLSEQLLCIRCGRCQAECPVWGLTGNIWGGNVYGGPMGIVWTAIVENISLASALSLFCLVCGRCMEVCPMKIDMPHIIRNLKSRLNL